MSPSVIDTIENLTRDFAMKRDVLSQRLATLEDEITTVQRRKMHGIKLALAAAQDAQAALAATIEANPHYFDKPRTITIEGIRVGLMKAKGRIAWDSPDQVVALIRKKFPDQSDTLIKVTESPARGALNNLTAAELKAIGCSIVDAGEQVVIKPKDSELDKLVDRLMGDLAELEEATA